MIWTSLTWLRKFAINVLFTLPGVTITTVVGDVLHVKHLGTDMYFAASVLWLLCYQILPGTAEENLEAVWARVNEYYKAYPSPYRYSNMKLSMFINPERPYHKMAKLKGRGAEVKALMPALLWVWTRYYMVPGNQQHEEIKLGLQCSSRIDEILEENKEEYKLNDVVAKEFEFNVWVFLLMQNSLAMFYSALGFFIFDITPKSHYLAHIGLFAKYLNPRLGWCYAGEDFMHVVKTLGASSAIGNRAARVNIKQMQKYSTGLFFDIMRYEEGEDDPVED
jgi:hypothetical protein